MPRLSSPTTRAGGASTKTPALYNTRRLMGIYVYYRLNLGLLLGVSHWSGLSETIFGAIRPVFFNNIVFFYIAICSVSLITYWSNILQATSRYLLSLLIIDLVALVLMIYASGTLTGGLGYLLLIPIAVGSTFLRGQANIGLAAFGTILILTMSLFNARDGLGDSQSIFAAGITGVLLFVTAIAFHLFSEKLQLSQYTAKRQSEHADYLQSISQRIVETMQTGIIVIDNHLSIQLINHAAAVLLTVNDKFEGLTQISAINQRLELWKNDGIVPASFTLSLANEKSLRISFATLTAARIPSVMLFLEDTQRINKAAQQLKLASLGRLTASIAHEIRNPLGAISHASQLLNESDTITDKDQELLTIIHNHSQRIDDIINSVLAFSRKKSTRQQTIKLKQWLADFTQQYLRHHPGNITLTADSDQLQCHIDPTHLYQIINNLVTNGIRYNDKARGEKHVTLHIAEHSDKRTAIEIIDQGDGIRGDQLDNLFEPFYTTEATGSGLGLFICKELCEANLADISYRYDSEKKQSIFRVLLNT
ncbi:MAG: histidine kinase [Cellvibrionaceae bacterium]|nr:histidine kinase [Cellvibrionaceae bacterium]